jgi:hypothetical protein
VTDGGRFAPGEVLGERYRIIGLLGPGGMGEVYRADDPAAINAFMFTLPGASGIRNPVRGDGTIGLDTGLAKRWTMPWNEHHSLQFRWEVFNVPNWNRFNVQYSSAEIDISSTFGNYSGLLTSPRVMQFALRYEF